MWPTNPHPSTSTPAAFPSTSCNGHKDLHILTLWCFTCGFLKPQSGRFIPLLDLIHPKCYRIVPPARSWKTYTEVVRKRQDKPVAMRCVALKSCFNHLCCEKRYHWVQLWLHGKKWDVRKRDWVIFWETGTTWATWGQNQSQSPVYHVQATKP